MASARALLKGYSLPEEQGKLALDYGGYEALPSITRAQRMSDALSQLLAHGGENLKSPIGLAGNLLATVLLNKGYNDANDKLTAQTNMAMQGQVDAARAQVLADMKGPGGSPLST